MRTGLAPAAQRTTKVTVADIYFATQSIRIGC
jgi:hypothetical protein